MEYSLIFAGRHGVGKTSIFSYLKRQLPTAESEVSDSISNNRHQFVTMMESHGTLAKVSQPKIDALNMEVACT